MLILENETKLMEKKLDLLQKSMQREKQLSRWNTGFNSTKYSKLIRSKKNIILDEKKAKQ